MKHYIPIFIVLASLLGLPKLKAQIPQGTWIAGATLLESKNKEVLVKKSLVKDKIILIQASDNEASSSKKYFFGN